MRIGFIALSDCAPLLVADELGYFETEGVNVELHREAGWATIREKVLYRQLDATHSVVGLGLSLRLGLHGLTCPAICPMVLSANGNVITLSRDLWQRGVRDAASLGKLVRSSAQRMLTFGVVALTSSHNFLLREWLKSGGVNPDQDVRMVVLPPTQMAGTLSAGLIDGFCAGDPWNSLSVMQGTGWCPALSEDIMPGHPDKVLVTTEDFAREKPTELHGIIRALHNACIYCEDKSNREQVVEILHASGQIHVSREVLRMSLCGPFDDGTKQRRDVERFYTFHRADLNEPTSDKAEWLASQFIQHGLATNAKQTHQEALACYRTDIYQAAMAASPAKIKNKSKALATTQS